METSASIAKISAALVKAQGELKPALKTATNDAFKRNGKGSSYATLNDCVLTAQPILAKYELAIIGGICGHEYVSRLIHSSGEWFQNRIPLPSGVSTAQQLIACQTYFRRASYALINLSADEDDDGNEAATAGGWNHKPADDLGKKVDTKVVNKYAKAIIDAQDDQDKLWSIWAEVKEDHDLAVAVWGALPASIKNRVTDAKAAKEPKAA